MTAKIYLASSFFDRAGYLYTAKIARSIRRNTDFEVYVPQENESINDKDNVEGITGVDIYEADINELVTSDYLIPIIDGLAIDPGVAAEIGYFTALAEDRNNNEFFLDKQIIGLLTDMRHGGEGEHGLYRNLFVKGAIQKFGTIVHNEEDLISVLLKLQREEEISIWGKLSLFLY